MWDLRCPWATKTEIEQEYHDTEWGRPQFDDRKLFEFIVLESAQAGLSWLTILKRRDGYRARFDGFDAESVADWGEPEIEAALGDTGIIRNRAKIVAAVGNARVFCELAAKHGRFADFIWGYVDGQPIVNHWRAQEYVPAHTPLSDRIAKDLKGLGFRFFGSTICYSHMQATGMINDHVVHCPQHKECQEAPTP